MSVEHHDLIHDFPEYKDKIHALKKSNHHFQRLYEQYEELTHSIRKMEDELTPVATITEEEAKMKRVHLKDELFSILKNS